MIRVEHWRSIETRAYAIACAYGRGVRLNLIIIEELRLMLRWARRHRVAMLEAA